MVDNNASNDMALLIQDFSESVSFAQPTILSLSQKLHKDPNEVHAQMNALTPLQVIPMPATEVSPAHNLVVKREDLSPVLSFKIRGAYNNIQARIDRGETIKKLVTASAGNHAQGVAWVANMLKIPSVIFMPASTPQSKIDAVEKFGEDYVTVDLSAKTFEEAKTKAEVYANKDEDSVFVSPFDDMDVIAGQATIYTEAVEQLKAHDLGNITHAFLQVGGGGLFAGVGTQAHLDNPTCHIIPVEEEGQACFAHAIEQGKPTPLETVSTYCEGTAVAKIGDVPFALSQKWCKNDVTIVSKKEVDAAANDVMSYLPTRPETSGSMGWAGYLQHLNSDANMIKEGDNVLVVISGANIDNSKLHQVTADPASKQNKKKSFQFELSEENGGMLELIQNIFPDINISSFQYGRQDSEKAWPILGFNADPKRLKQLEKYLSVGDVPYRELSEKELQEATYNRADPQLMKDSHFYTITFREGAGSLRNLMENVKENAGVTFFQYDFQGGTESDARMAFEGDPKVLEDIFTRTDGIVKFTPEDNPYIFKSPFWGSAPSV